MQIVKERPPIYDAICAALGKPPDNAVFAFGDSIYNPSGSDIPEDIIVHECVHKRQQGDDPMDWWKKYLRDDEFRLEQEIEAYGAQYRWAHHNIKDREKRQRMLNQMARTLASPTYELDITVQQARVRIHKQSGV